MTRLADTCARTAAREVFMFPASFGQRRLWLSHQRNPQQSIYHIPNAVRAKGPFDLEVLRRSVNEIVRRHESMRTRFESIDGEPYQVIEAEVEVEVPIIDLSSESEQKRDLSVRQLVNQEVNKPFDLQKTPLWRIKIFRLDHDDHVLVIVMHHIISDGWSIGVMLGEVSLLYSALDSNVTSPLPELPIQYADFSEWERDMLRGKALDKQLTYWKSQLSGTQALKLPYDRPKHSPPPGRGAAFSLRLEPVLAESLRNLSQQQNVTLYMTLLAAYQTLLYGYTGQTDIAVGCNIARRTRFEVQGLIGYFANNLILRTRLSEGWSFRELLVRVKEIALDAYAHQDIPLDRVIQELGPERDPNRPLIFHATFTLQNLPPSDFRLGTAVLSSFDVETAPAKHDISVFVADPGGPILLDALYNRDLFDPDTIAGLFRNYELLLHRVAEQPEQSLSELATAITGKCFA